MANYNIDIKDLFNISGKKSGEAYNLDNLLDPGTYYANTDSTNLPMNYFGVVVVIRTLTYAFQFYTRASVGSDANNFNIYMRKIYLTSMNKTPWKAISFTDI